MELKRKIYFQIEEWKNKKERKALVIEGLRQIGKTYIVKKFANENYRNVYYFDFRQYDSHRGIFKGNFDLNTFKENLFIVFKRDYDDSDAVLVMDEIGDCADARSAIKYILKETNFDIIATGSLLGVKGFKNKENRSPSVGSNEFITMHPLDFEEFLWANNIKEEAIDKIKHSIESFEPIEQFLHSAFTDLFRHYILTGGMPEAVIEYLKSHDFSKVIKTNIDKLKELQGDFGRIVDENNDIRINEKLLNKTNEVYSTIVSQLAKDNSKFQYSFIKKGARAKEYDEAITWLENSGMISKCYNLNDLALPLVGYVNYDSFKIYFSDIGLYVAKMGLDAASLILNNQLNSYGGYIYEGIIADILAKYDYPLYYSDNGKSEIDFVLQENNSISILEVKMNNGKSKSARAVIEGLSNRHASKCYKVTGNNFSIGSYYYGLPHYALGFLLDKIKDDIKNSLIVEGISI